MPEVCEVALSAAFLATKIIDYKITDMDILGGRYSKCPPSNLDSFKSKLPLLVTNVGSKGKQMWFKLKDVNDKFVYLLSHFGMEGKWGFDKDKHSHLKFKLKIANKSKGKTETINQTLYFSDYRNFGRIEFVFKHSLFKDLIDNIGPDFLKNKLNKNILKTRIKDYLYNGVKLRKQRADKNIMTVLMCGQKKKDGIGSGIGNYLCCEILYRAKISPHTTMETIYKSDDLLKTLAYNIKYTIKLAYLTNKTGYLGRNMTQFLKNHRKNISNKKTKDYHDDIKIDKDQFEYLVYRKKTDPDGNDVYKEEIIKKRTAHWVPDVQN